MRRGRDKLQSAFGVETRAHTTIRCVLEEEVGVLIDVVREERRLRADEQQVTVVLVREPAAC